MKLTTKTNGMIDLEENPSGFGIDYTLQSAIYVSLLTDRRANLDDALPSHETQSGIVPPNRRGWCGDALSPIANDRIGSRLWLLEREKVTEQTRRRALDYSKEALQWLIDDGHVLAVAITGTWEVQAGIKGRLNLAIKITTLEGDLQDYATSIPIGV